MVGGSQQHCVMCVRHALTVKAGNRRGGGGEGGEVQGYRKFMLPILSRTQSRSAPEADKAQDRGSERRSRGDGADSGVGHEVIRLLLFLALFHLIV